MSDFESIKDDAAWDAMLDDRYFEHRADLQEQAEATLLELLRNIDLDDILTKHMDQDPYRDPLHAVLIGLTEAIQQKIDQEQETRSKGGIYSGISRRKAADEKLEKRQEVANPLFLSGQYETKEAVATEVLKREIAYSRSDRDENGKEKTPEIISEDEEHYILHSERDYLARRLKDPRK